MKRLKPEKISTIILWFCMAITLGIFGRFYFSFAQHPDIHHIAGTDWILDWSFIILVIAISTLLAFSVYYFLKSGVKNSKKKFQPLIWFVLLILLLFISYKAGSGQQLTILGYDGNENTYFWLKLTDMWIYSIYILLGMSIAALISGIIWSYYKKK